MFDRAYAPAYQLQGNICQKLAQRQDAIQAYKPRASLYLKQQDKENSRLCLTKAEELGPRYEFVVPSTNSLSYSYAGAIAKAESGDLWGALQEANDRCKKSPRCQTYCCRAGVIQMMRAQYQGRSLILITQFAWILKVIQPISHRVECVKKWETQGAIADFNQALLLNDQDWQLYGFRAKAYASIGKL